MANEQVENQKTHTHFPIAFQFLPSPRRHHHHHHAGGGGGISLHHLLLFSKSIHKSSTSDQLKPVLFYLCKVGFKDLHALAGGDGFKGEILQGKLEELQEFPQYFAFSLEKRIKPRHMEVGFNVPLPLMMMIKSTDEEFRE